MVSVTINGQSMDTDHNTVKPMLDELQLTQGRYAVEINGDLVPKSELDLTELKQGMVIEVVQAVGGG